MSSGGGVDLYGASYRNFASALYEAIRREAFGEDIGQTGWLTAEEQDLFIGCPSWTRIETCAWRRSQVFGASLRKSVSCRFCLPDLLAAFPETLSEPCVPRRSQTFTVFFRALNIWCPPRDDTWSHPTVRGPNREAVAEPSREVRLSVLEQPSATWVG
jgi:hypothetical protein